MQETTSVYIDTTDKVEFKSCIARSEIEIIGKCGYNSTTVKMSEFTTRELKDVLYSLKYANGNKKIRIRDAIVDFTGKEDSMGECIKHIQRVLDHRNKYKMV